MIKKINVRDEILFLLVRCVCFAEDQIENVKKTFSFTIGLFQSRKDDIMKIEDLIVQVKKSFNSFRLIANEKYFYRYVDKKLKLIYQIYYNPDTDSEDLTNGDFSLSVSGMDADDYSFIPVPNYHTDGLRKEFIVFLNNQKDSEVKLNDLLKDL